MKNIFKASAATTLALAFSACTPIQYPSQQPGGYGHQQAQPVYVSPYTGRSRYRDFVSPYSPYNQQGVVPYGQDVRGIGNLNIGPGPDGKLGVRNLDIPFGNTLGPLIPRIGF
jgi:hypothetical protein